MKIKLLFTLLFVSICNLYSQDFYIGIGGTVVSSTFNATEINKELSTHGVNSIDDIKYDNWGISAKIRVKITERIGANLGYSYIFSTKKDVPLEANINIPILGNQTYNAIAPTNISANNFSFDASYSFIENKLIDVFALAGVDYSIGKLSIDYPDEVKNLVQDITKYENYDDAVVGFNFGAGITTKIGIFAEIKSKHDLSQYQATLGYLYKF